MCVACDPECQGVGSGRCFNSTSQGCCPYYMTIFDANGIECVSNCGDVFGPDENFTCSGKMEKGRGHGESWI